MGHIHLHNIPQSKQWRDVVGLITDGAAVAQIAAASAKAAEHGLTKAADDAALAHSFWLLTQMPQAARQADFGSQLRALGLRVSDTPTLLEITAGFTEAIDRLVLETGRRTDLGEMAQLAAAESLNALVGSYDGIWVTTVV